MFDPYPFYASIRSQPGLRTPSGEVAIARYGDVVAALGDQRFVKPPQARVPMKSIHVLSRMFLLLDPPDHTRLRRVVGPSFTASAIERLRPKITSIANGLLPPRSCTVDLVRDFAYPLPLAVVAELLGIPEDDQPMLAAWSATLARSLDEQPSTRVRDLPRTIMSVATRKINPVGAFRAANGIVRYARRQIALADNAASSELLDVLARGLRDGALDADEAAATWIMMAIAGHETTANLIGNGVVALLRHPDALRQASGSTTAATNAVEEALRYDSPIPHTPRVVAEDMSLNGMDLARGTPALLLMAAANRDPDAFPRPDEFDLDRPKTPPHLGLGHGIHFCLGSALARLEGEIALTTLLARLYLTQDLTGVVQRPTVAVQGIESFPVTLRPPEQQP